MHRWQSMHCYLFQECAQLMVAPPPRIADPFDRPDNFPELLVNRIQASLRVLSAQPKPEVRFSKSLFGQLYGEMEGWSNEKFRRWVTLFLWRAPCQSCQEDGGLVGGAGGCYSYFQWRRLILPCPVSN